MKKIILCIMLCASNMHSMQQDINNLPDEIQKQIVLQLVVKNDIDTTIKALKTFSLTTKKHNHIVSKQYGNIGTLAGFTAFVAQLGKNFPIMTRDQIAATLKTEMSKEYISLGEQLLQAADSDESQTRLDTITELINQGADVGYNQTKYSWSKFIIGGPTVHGPALVHSVLRKALAHACKQEDELSIAIVNLLLSKGATLSCNRGMMSLFKVVEHQAKKKKDYLLDMLKKHEAK